MATSNTTTSGRPLADALREDANFAAGEAKRYLEAYEVVGAMAQLMVAAQAFSTLERLEALTPQDRKIYDYVLLQTMGLQKRYESGELSPGAGSRAGSGGPSGKDGPPPKAKPLALKGKDCVYFRDVIGLESVKTAFDEGFINPIVYPALFTDPSKGFLLYGPPGTGKTFVVKAAVNELKAKIEATGRGVISVYFKTAGDLKGKYVGETEKNINALFNDAEADAVAYEEANPGKKAFAIVFLDEVENIAGDRNKDPSGMMRNSVNALLVNMDGVEAKEHVSVIAATNNPEELDSAFMRRIDGETFLDLPSHHEIVENINLQIDLLFARGVVEKGPEKGADCAPPTDVTTMGRVWPRNEALLTVFRAEESVLNSVIEQAADHMYRHFFSNSDVNRWKRALSKHLAAKALNTGFFRFHVFDREDEVKVPYFISGDSGVVTQPWLEDGEKLLKREGEGSKGEWDALAAMHGLMTSDVSETEEGEEEVTPRGDGDFMKWIVKRKGQHFLSTYTGRTLIHVDNDLKVTNYSLFPRNVWYNKVDYPCLARVFVDEDETIAILEFEDKDGDKVTAIFLNKETTTGSLTPLWKVFDEEIDVTDTQVVKTFLQGEKSVLALGNKEDYATPDSGSTPFFFIESGGIMVKGSSLDPKKCQLVKYQDNLAKGHTFTIVQAMVPDREGEAFSAKADSMVRSFALGAEDLLYPLGIKGKNRDPVQSSIKRYNPKGDVVAQAPEGFPLEYNKILSQVGRAMPVPTKDKDGYWGESTIKYISGFPVRQGQVTSESP